MLQYRGTLRAENGTWFTTVTQTNDPTAVGGAIPTTISFDGTTLAMQNSFGQTWVWRRQ
jgi:hypothetical protein